MFFNTLFPCASSHALCAARALVSAAILGRLACFGGDILITRDIRVVLSWAGGAAKAGAAPCHHALVPGRFLSSSAARWTSTGGATGARPILSALPASATIARASACLAPIGRLEGWGTAGARAVRATEDGTAPPLPFQSNLSSAAPNGLAPEPLAPAPAGMGVGPLLLPPLPLPF